MNPIPITPDLTVAAPEIGRRLGVILAGLATLIARAFLRHPRAALVVPLWNYLARTTRRFNTLMDRIASRGALHLADGRLPRKRAPANPTGARSGSRPIELPRTRAWLLTDLKHEAAAYRTMLETLLADPAAAHLLATIPAAGRLLRPLGHMLGLDIGRRPVVKAPEAAAPPPVLSPLPPFAEPRAPAARTHAPPQRPDVAPPPAPRSPPLCPRARWPWFTTAKSPA